MAETIVGRHELPPTLAARILRAPLALHQRALATILTANPRADAGGAAGRSTFGYTIVEGVAVVPIVGCLMKRGTGDDWLDRLFGICPVDTLQATLRTAALDPAATAILLQIDSPGGEVHGMFDAAAAVAAARDAKPTWAVADEWATSAAYLVASAAERVIAPPTAYLGSIGIVATRLDATKYDEKLGLDYHVVTSGARKADGNPHTTPSDAELGDLEAEVERMARLFVDAVAAYRPRLSADVVRGFDAATFNGDDAQRLGLTDQVASFTDAILDLATQPRATRFPRQRRQSMSTQASADAPTGAEVIDMEARRKAREDGEVAGRTAATTEERARLAAIRDMCAAAGAPELAAQFGIEGVSLEAVAKQLAERRVAADQSGRIDATQAPAAAPVTLNGSAFRAKRRQQVMELAAQRAAAMR